MAVSVAFVCVLSLGIAAVRADENSETDTGSDASRKGTSQVRVRDFATERKAQMGGDDAKNGASTGNNSENRQAKREESAADRQQNLCENMIERNAKMSERLDGVQKDILDRKTTRRNVFDESRDERDTALERDRNERDARREEMYARLLEQAGDDANKKSAVVAFKAAVEKAVADRRQMVDSAIGAFRTGVDSAIGAKRTTVDASLSEFKSAIDAAFASAKNDCASGVDPASVRETLRANLKDAKVAAENQRRDSDAVGEQVRMLAEAKRVSFAAALSDFKLALEQARTDLKAAFGTTESESESNS